MARERKTWARKLADAKARMPEPRKWYCKKSAQQFVIPSVVEVEAFMRRVRPGGLMTMKQMTDHFRQKYDTDVTCFMTTGIFVWIIAHAAYEEEQAGRKRVVPWWRVLKTGGALNPKFPGQGDLQRARLEAEGHHIIQKGKRLVVADYQHALVGDATLEPPPEKRAKGIQPQRGAGQ